MTIEVRRATIAPHTHHGTFCGLALHQENQLARRWQNSSTVVNLYKASFSSIRYGVTANIAAFHAAARGSIPRIGEAFFLLVDRPPNI